MPGSGESLYNAAHCSNFWPSVVVNGEGLMPVYDYTCRACGRGSRLFMSFAEYDSVKPVPVRTAAGLS